MQLLVMYPTRARRGAAMGWDLQVEMARISCRASSLSAASAARLWRVCEPMTDSGHREGASMQIAVYGVQGVTMFHLSVPQMVVGEVARLGLARGRRSFSPRTADRSAQLRDTGWRACRT